jgi:hypothetical protein
LVKGPAEFLYAFAVAFAGMQGLLLAGEALAVEGTGDGAETTGKAQAVAQFGERGIGLVAYQGEQTLDVVRAEAGLGSSGMGFRLDGAGIAASIQQADEEGEADGEEACQLAEGMFVAIDGGDDARSSSGFARFSSPPTGSSCQG